MLAAIEEAKKGQDERGFASLRSSFAMGAFWEEGTTGKCKRAAWFCTPRWTHSKPPDGKADIFRRCTLYITLSPCAMCSGAILLYGIPRVVIGENRTFRGEDSLLHTRGVASDVLDEPACVAMMKSFIAAHPALWNEDIGI